MAEGARAVQQGRQETDDHQDHFHNCTSKTKHNDIIQNEIIYAAQALYIILVVNIISIDIHICTVVLQYLNLANHNTRQDQLIQFM